MKKLMLILLVVLLLTLAFAGPAFAQCLVEYEVAALLKAQEASTQNSEKSEEVLGDLVSQFCEASEDPPEA